MICACIGIKLLYTTPEKLLHSPRFLNALKNLYDNQYFSRVVIDEAHCVSEWGCSFRPDYLSLQNLKGQFPNTPTMILTATACPRVREDILRHLGVENCLGFIGSCDRPNLSYEIHAKRGNGAWTNDLLTILKSPNFKDKCGIVYALSREECDNVAKKLQESSITVRNRI